MESSKWALNCRSWGAFQALGALERLTGVPWQTSRVTCLQSCTLLVVDHTELEGLMNRIQAEIEQNKKVDFLSAYIPGMKSLGAVSKEKMAHCFHFVHIKTKKRVLHAHESASFAYIIISGECLEVSKAANRRSEGLASRTMSQVNFGLVTKGQWVGAESILEGKCMEFEVVTVSEVQAYRVSKQDLLEKLGRDTVALLKELLARQNSWRTLRKALVEATFAPYVPPVQDKVVSAGTPTVNKRIRQLRLQQETSKSEFAPLQRPQTAPIRPASAASLSLSFWFAQFPKNSANSGLRPQSKERGKRHLALAATLGKAMVPAVTDTAKKRLGRTQSVGRCTPLRPGSVKDHFGYNAKREEGEDLTYMQRIQRPRADSPNPMNASTSWLIITKAAQSH